MAGVRAGFCFAILVDRKFFAAVVATVRNFVVLIVPRPMLSRRHELQVFDAIVTFVAVEVVNYVTFGNVAEVKMPNSLVQ